MTDPPKKWNTTNKRKVSDKIIILPSLGCSCVDMKKSGSKDNTIGWEKVINMGAYK